MSVRQNGFVLVNALIIVAALAGAAVVLLARAETGRARLEASQISAQLSAYLDAFEARAIALLDADRSFGPVDHTREDWAQPDYAVAVDRGRVTGVITELQGRYNLNWLANRNRITARPALEAMLTRRGMPSGIADQIASFMQPGGPENRSPYRTQTPPIDPVGGALLLFEQLADIPTLNAEQRDTLRAFTTVLPGASRINVNTADPDLLISLLPQVTAGAMNQLLLRREVEPFTSVEAFVEEVELLVQDDDDETETPIDPGLFSVGSEWFRVEISATLDGHVAHRDVVLQRLGVTQGIRTHWRITQFP